MKAGIAFSIDRNRVEDERGKEKCRQEEESYRADLKIPADAWMP